VGNVALLIAGSLVVYAGFFYLLSLVLQIGTPLDAVWAGLYRTGLGAVATLVTLVVHIFFRMAMASPESLDLAGDISVWVLRIAVWLWVATWVYRVTRWRKGKLAVVVLAGLALNFGIDYGLHKAAFVPAFGTWAFRLC
jgi:hypothetical protein